MSIFRKINKKICKILNKGNLPSEQSKLLTNRYCTLKLLEDVNLKEYDKYIIMIQDLGNTYYSDAKFFINARFYVECTNNSYKKYYIDKIDEENVLRKLRIKK